MHAGSLSTALLGRTELIDLISTDLGCYLIEAGLEPAF